jgi:acetylornithine/N-succinyldiaminopimelate aminotransferase
MFTNRQLFLQHLGQTSLAPMMLEIVRAEGIYMYGSDGKKYIDLISGVSVSNTGHCHPKVVEAVKTQAGLYMHLMVYGEYIQSPQVKYAAHLAEILPPSLTSCYFVNSGSEAVEGALKLAKRYTGKSRIISFKNAYHGSTHGALSVQGSEI